MGWNSTNYLACSRRHSNGELHIPRRRSVAFPCSTGRRSTWPYRARSHGHIEIGGGSGIRTRDLMVMSHTRYRCAIPRQYQAELGEEVLFATTVILAHRPDIRFYHGRRCRRPVLSRFLVAVRLNSIEVFCALPIELTPFLKGSAGLEPTTTSLQR